MSAAPTVNKPSVTVQRRYDAPPAKVYAAWTHAEMIVRWFGPSDAVQDSVKAEIDARPGGRFSISFTRGSGDDLRVSGIYKEVVPNEKLVFSWSWSGHESQVTVTTKPDGKGTLLTLKHEQFADEAARDAHQRGWVGSLEKLAAYLER